MRHIHVNGIPDQAEAIKQLVRAVLIADRQDIGHLIASLAAEIVTNEDGTYTPDLSEGEAAAAKAMAGIFGAKVLEILAMKPLPMMDVFVMGEDEERGN